MFFKTDAERASAQAAKARHDAGEAGSIAATGARNLGAAVLATLAEATAPRDDTKGRKHAQKARAKALKAATHDREAASKAASSAAEHGRKAADLGLAAADRRTAKVSKVAQKKAAKANKRAEKSAGRLADSARERAEHLAQRTGPLRADAKEKAGVSAAMLTALAAAARDKAEETRNRAVLGVDHGIDAAVPRAQEGVAAVGPRVDHLRDVINEELLPKIQAMLGDVQANKDRVLIQDEGFAAAVTGSPKKRTKKGGVLIALGLLAAAGAAFAWWLGEQEKKPAKDPWASQAGGADPWASRTPTTAAGTTPEVAGAAGATSASATTTAATTSAADTTSPSAQSFGVGSEGAAATAGTTSSTEGAAPVAGGSPDDNPRMLDSEEIDDLASDEPSTADDQAPGESPTEEIAAAREHHGEPVGHDSGSGTDAAGDDSRAHEEAEAREEADDATWSGAIDRSDEDDRAGLGTGPDVDPGPGQPPLDRPEAERRHDSGSSGI